MALSEGGITWQKPAEISWQQTVGDAWITQKWFESLAADMAAVPEKTFPSVATFATGGLVPTFTVAELAVAIDALVASPGSQVRPVLKAIGSPLAAVDHRAWAAQEMKADPALRKGPQKTKDAFVVHLRKKLAALTVTDAQVPDGVSYRSLVDAGVAPVYWPESTRRQYIADYLPHLGGPDKFVACCWRPDGCGGQSRVARAISTHLRLVAAQKKAAEDAVLRFSYAEPQPQLSGYHRKYVLVDQHGGRWLFKPVAGAGRAFRAEVEHAAHRLARAWGFLTAESRLITFDGMYGQLQRMFVEKGNFVDVAGADFSAYPVEQLAAVACEHLLDWALDNDDGKGDNLLITDSGAVVGVDKARAWVYFGGWDGLSSHDSANSNAPLVYTELYRAIKGGHLARDVVDGIYRAVMFKARRMARLPDGVLADIVRAGVANRPHFAPPSYRSAVRGAPTCADELIAAATARKNSLPADMRALWERVYAGTGWQLPDLAAGTLGCNAQGHPMYAGLHESALHAAVAESKSYGTAAFVAGTSVEDAHILLWRERRGETFRVRGQFKTRGQAFERLKAWCLQQVTSGPAGAYTVARLPATRAAASLDEGVLLADDGELVVDGGVLSNEPRGGQPGQMFLVTLPTGEEIEFRADTTTSTPLSTRGLTQFTIPNEATIAQSLWRIEDQLAEMGLSVEPADRDDLELYYWRHLKGVLADRCDSRPDAAQQQPRFVAFWSRVREEPMSKTAEIAMWREAFAQLAPGVDIGVFLAGDGHLPRFMHMDLRNPQLPCGKPYWERFDVPVPVAMGKQMPSLFYRSGPRWVIATGVCMATEARIRTFAIWKGGQSPGQDLASGGAGFVFTRQNQEVDADDEAYLPTVYFNPRVLLRTTNYGFDHDFYGRTSARSDNAPFDFEVLTSFSDGGNELLIKDAVSLLDDIEILVFEDAADREAALARLAGFGLTHIRGLPLATRFVCRRDNESAAAARAVVRESLTRASQFGQ